MTIIFPVCTGCQRRPANISEYIEAAEESGMTPDEYVKRQEGTYNRANGHFLCTSCYIDEGMPTSLDPTKPGWVAP